MTGALKATPSPVGVSPQPGDTVKLRELPKAFHYRSLAERRGAHQGNVLGYGNSVEGCNNG